MKGCKRSGSTLKDKYGHCICDDCKKYRYSVSQKNPGRKEYKLNWAKNNPEKISGYSKKWNERNKEQKRLIEKAWRYKNPEKVKQMSNRAGAKWAKNNKGKRNAIDVRRKYALIKRTPKWADLNKIRDFYIESERLTLATGIPHEVDHIIPLQGKLISGLHVHNNLQILTRSENRSKRNSIIL